MTRTPHQRPALIMHAHLVPFDNNLFENINKSIHACKFGLPFYLLTNSLKQASSFKSKTMFDQKKVSLRKKRDRSYFNRLHCIVSFFVSSAFAYLMHCLIIFFCVPHDVHYQHHLQNCSSLYIIF